jgi:hypothetical protein
VARDWEAIAKRAYEAYDQDRGGLNYQGKPNPKWAELPEGIRHAWKVAALAVGEEIAKPEPVET